MRCHTRLLFRLALLELVVQLRRTRRQCADFRKSPARVAMTDCCRTFRSSRAKADPDMRGSFKVISSTTSIPQHCTRTSRESYWDLNIIFVERTLLDGKVFRKYSRYAMSLLAVTVVLRRGNLDRFSLIAVRRSGLESSPPPNGRSSCHSVVRIAASQTRFDTTSPSPVRVPIAPRAKAELR
jgi:hypothetical protein